MSSDHTTLKSVVAGIVIGSLTLFGIAAVYSYRNPTPLEQVLSLVTGSPAEVAEVIEETPVVSEETNDGMQVELADVAAAIAAAESPAARLALVKSYIAEFSALLTPASQKELDAIIVFVELNLSALDDLDSLPASYSASLKTIKGELQQALGVVTVASSQEDEDEASPSAGSSTPRAVVGQSYTLTGLLSLVETDELLGGAYFVMTDTNYGEPFYLYLTGSQVPVIEDTMVGEIVTVEVEVTSIEEGFVRYIVLSGPVLGETVDSSDTTASPSATES